MILNIELEHFIEVMKKKELQLPVRWDGLDFLDSLKDLLDLYLNQLKDKISEDDYNQIDTICKGILSTIEEYYNGFPSEALTELDKFMEILITNPVKIYQKTGWTDAFNGSDPLQLYRVRTVSENKIFKRSDLFHTPFSLRSHVASCRYSISGYPSLYLGTSIKLCLEEVKKRKIDEIQVVSRFNIERNMAENGRKSIKVIEMGIKPEHFINKYNFRFNRNIEYKVDYYLNYREESKIINTYLNEIDLLNSNIISNYLKWYPLIAACSFIRIDKNSSFASEYIVPQILMQWIRKKSTKESLFGIRYFSCASIKSSQLGFNYVFPVGSEKYSRDKKYCDILAKSFKLTVPRHIDEFSTLEECEFHLKEDNNLTRI